MRRIALTALLAFTASTLSAQFAVKTNLLGWATTTPNIGIEIGAGHHSTIELMGYINPWNFKDGKYFHFYTVQPEYRYWFCEKFNGWFLGVHLMGGQYNVKGINFPFKALTWGNVYDQNPDFADAADHKGGWPDVATANENGAFRHVEAWYAGAGISAGYQWMLSKHWNLEASLGIGYVYSDLKYIGRCQRDINRQHMNYVGLTNAQVSFLYIF